MSLVAEQPPQQQTTEQLRSFDPLASVNMLRFDLDHFGEVLPETREQVVNEELSFLSEAVDKPVCNDFVLKRQGSDLVYFKHGKWRPYGGLLRKGSETARQEAAHDFRRQFLVDWADRDEAKGVIMRKLQPGERHSWINSYPHEIEAQYGTSFTNSCGLRSDRKMGFIYQAECLEDGSVVLWSQTVDRSDTDAFAAVEAAIEYDQDIDIETMRRIYDGTLRQKYGEDFHAGRTEQQQSEQTWETIKSQQDLITYHLDELEYLASQNLPRAALERATKRHTYGVWASFEKRLKGEVYAPSIDHVIGSQVEVTPQMLLAMEVNHRFHEFAAAGKPMIGCGGSIEIMNDENIMNANPEDVFDAIFGRKTETYTFNKKMFCVVCQAPPQKNESKKMCGPCGLCRGCDKDAGGKG